MSFKKHLIFLTSGILFIYIINWLIAPSGSYPDISGISYIIGLIGGYIWGVLNEKQ